MIFGACPYCDHPMTFTVPDKTPALSRQTCDACGKPFWEYHSRVAPMAYTEDEFAAAFVLDEDAGTFRERGE